MNGLLCESCFDSADVGFRTDHLHGELAVGRVLDAADDAFENIETDAERLRDVLQHRLIGNLAKKSEAQQRSRQSEDRAQIGALLVVAALAHHAARDRMLRVQQDVGHRPVFDDETLVEHGDGAAEIAEHARDKRRHAELVQRLAPRFEVDPRLALAIVRSESNFQARALSPKNAQGLMQLIPETAERFGVRDVWNPEQNVRGGLTYLRWLLDRFGGDVALASAAYNAGEKAVERHGGVPPYSETREYVRRILGFYRAPLHERPGKATGLALPPATRMKKPPGP